MRKNRFTDFIHRRDPFFKPGRGDNRAKLTAGTNDYSYPTCHVTPRIPAIKVFFCRCSTQRAGPAPPHAEGERLSGVTSDRETFAFISASAEVVGGVPLTRAMNPWAMPEASV